MNKEEFLDFLAKKGFPNPVLVEQVANGYLDSHIHDFDVWALVLEGSIEIDINAKPSTYQAGDVFHLEYQQPHKESYGALGVKYLASRRNKSQS